MGDRTKIEWTDASWNPVTGCTRVSRGCDHCYAETFAERWRGTPGHYFENGFDVQLRPDKLDLPLRWTRPRRVFVNSMSDLFHDQVPDAYIAHVFAVMALAGEHQFQVLTKRHARMRSLLNSEAFYDRFGELLYTIEDPRGEVAEPVSTWPLPNVWIGVSVEDQQWADIRIPALLDTPAAVRFLSCEPLLGEICLDPWHDPHDTYYCGRGPADSRLDWVIVGGESGGGARPMYPGWVRLIRDQCQAAEVPFLFKQWGEYAPSKGKTGRQTFVWADGSYETRKAPIGDFLIGKTKWPTRPGWINVERVGKLAAGRMLDRRTWDEYPEPIGSGVDHE